MKNFEKFRKQKNAESSIKEKKIVKPKDGKLEKLISSHIGKTENNEDYNEEEISKKIRAAMKTPESNNLEETISKYIKKPEKREKSEPKTFDDVLEIISNKPEGSRSKNERLLLQTKENSTDLSLEEIRKLAENVRREIINKALESNDNSEQKRKRKRKLKVLIRALEICKNPLDGSDVNQEDVRELEDKIWDIAKTFEENDVSTSNVESLPKPFIPIDKDTIKPWQRQSNGLYKRLPQTSKNKETAKKKSSIPSLPSVNKAITKTKTKKLKQENIAIRRDKESKTISDAEIYKQTLNNLSKMAGIDLLTTPMKSIEEFVRNDEEGRMDGMLGMIKDYREELGINN